MKKMINKNINVWIYTIFCMHVPTTFLEEIQDAVVALVDCGNQMKSHFPNSKVLMSGAKYTEI